MERSRETCSLNVRTSTKRKFNWYSHFTTVRWTRENKVHNFPSLRRKVPLLISFEVLIPPNSPPWLGIPLFMHIRFLTTTLYWNCTSNWEIELVTLTRQTELRWRMLCSYCFLSNFLTTWSWSPVRVKAPSLVFDPVGFFLPDDLIEDYFLFAESWPYEHVAV